jgi:hypothetical protein
MTTKKILLMIGAVVVVLGFLVVCFVGAIVGFALYSLSRSEAAEHGRAFLRKNEKLQADIGPVKDFGRIVTGYAKLTDNNTSTATLHFKVIGERKTVNATVQLMLSNRVWVVTEAFYINSSGQGVELLNPYETKLRIPLLVA